MTTEERAANYASHETRYSDSSVFDEVCTRCGAKDYSTGDDELSAKPCPNQTTGGEGLREALRIGEQVRIADHCPDSELWNHEEYVVAGLATEYGRSGINVSIAHKVPTGEGQTDGFWIERPDKPDDLTRLAALSPAPQADDNRFWLELREPRCVPERKGPWPLTETAKVLREFMDARPTALITYVTVGQDGPLFQHGPEALQMADGRSMARGRKHNAAVNEAFASQGGEADDGVAVPYRPDFNAERAARQRAVADLGRRTSQGRR